MTRRLLLILTLSSLGFTALAGPWPRSSNAVWAGRSGHFLVEVYPRQDGPGLPRLFWGVPGEMREINYNRLQTELYLPSGNRLAVLTFTSSDQVPAFEREFLPRGSEIREVLVAVSPEQERLTYYFRYLGEFGLEDVGPGGQSCVELVEWLQPSSK